MFSQVMVDYLSRAIETEYREIETKITNFFKLEVFSKFDLQKF